MELDCTFSRLISLKKPMFRSSVIFLTFSLLASFFTVAQERPDTSFTFPIRQAAHQPGAGPLILVDEAHNNTHSINGRFFAFSKLLRQDGYRVLPLITPIITPELLRSCGILVIANALDSSNLGNWVLPTPSPFMKEEIQIIKEWVKEGGSLLLIADHMPFAGAAYKLGKVFGFEFINGFAFFAYESWPPMVFSADSGSLPQTPVSAGIREYEQVDRVATFTGSAIYVPDVATPVLSFLDGLTLQPDTAWIFYNWTPWENLGRYHQGAIRTCGKGKVAVFGETDMFTAILANDSVAVGFNSPYARQNAQFTLNLIHWLDGVEEYQGEIVGSGQ
ncbi:MAG: hypothetical protein IH596_11195 [Bacteroidales bacterium]|nr:hypothetical protein [Bacteroidales bacterium]